jgi:hypothetical protein
MMNDTTSKEIAAVKRRSTKPMHLHFAADRTRVGAHPRKRTSELDRFFITFVGASAVAEIANVLLPMGYCPRIA